jgi:alkanesulfonate monooxygenase SsuD/methylene tetrahydromethanopterin reductase-like flavin-dependent oxidoreductase (luciferase family)
MRFAPSGRTVPPVTTPLTRFGLLTTNYSWPVPPDGLFPRLVDVVRAAESGGFDTLWVPDHIVQGAVGDLSVNTGGEERVLAGPAGPRMPIFDAPTILAALAVATDTIRIGPLVSPVTLREPAILAKSITTTDVVSGGRAILGVGAAWDGDEHRRYGMEFPPPGERVDRLEDAVRICRAMFDEEAATVAGRFHSVDEAYNVPRPVQAHLPILVGGNGKRTLRIAALYADACNPIGTAGMVRDALATFQRHLDDIGRDPAEVSRPAGVMFHRLDDLWRQAEEAFSIGCDGVILVPWQQAFTPDEIAAIGERLVREFGPG